MAVMRKISAGLLSGVKAAEKSLAQSAAEDLADLPDNHPLKAVVEQERAKLGGDLSELPPGHPLLKELQEAKIRYDSAIAKEGNDAQDRTAALRRAKKVQDARRHIEARADEDTALQARKDAAKAVAERVATVAKQVDDLTSLVNSNMDKLAIDGMGKMQMTRTIRFLQAVRQGMAECRASVSRMA